LVDIGVILQGRSGMSHISAVRILTWLSILLLCGCATWNSWTPETRFQETVWQLTHSVDVAQTVQAARDPNCYGEKNFLIGPHPSVPTVIVSGLAISAGHWMFTDWIERNFRDHLWVQDLWFVTSTFVVGHAVANNWQIGLRVGSSKCQQ